MNFAMTPTPKQDNMASLISIINTLRSKTIYTHQLDIVHIDMESIASGNNAVVARCRLYNCDTPMLLKCYFHKKRHTATIYRRYYYPNEIDIYTIGGRMEPIDVVCQPWIEGEPLDKLLGSADADYAALSRSFDELAYRTLSGTMAHGDIKPDNIIVCPDGRMELIDWDAAWCSELAHSTPDEWGTPQYRHYARGEGDYNRHIDNYPIAMVSTMLAALAADRELFEQHLDEDKSLFDIRSIATHHDELLNRAIDIFGRRGDALHYYIAKSLYSRTYILPNIKEALSYANIQPPRYLTNNISLESRICRWGCHRDGKWIIPPLYTAIDFHNNQECILSLDEYIHRCPIRQPFSVERDGITAADISRMHKLQELRSTDSIADILCSRPHNRSGRPWSFDEEDLVVSMISSEYEIEYVAYRIGRSPQSIRNHFAKLGGLPRDFFRRK